jgi:signal transduction histidine kinase/NO-binding membrane sensor protein with MHYT domain
MLVASLAGYAALELSARVANASGWNRGRWTAASAIAMGVGIWSMHFVAMLALRLDVPVVYNTPLLALSIVIAISASAITFTGAARSVTTSRLALASLAMGPAIAGMHYTGMASMRMPARIDYHQGLVTLSVAIAITASFAALWLARHFRDPVRHGGKGLKILASVVMGAAVYGMHYTGMVAARFVAVDERVSHAGVIASDSLAWAIAAGATVVMVLALIAGVAGRRVDAAQMVALEAVQQQARVVETLHQVGRSLTAELDLKKIVQSVTDAGTTLTGAQFGAFFYNLVNEAGEAYTLYTISGVPRSEFERFPMPRNTPVFGPTFYGEGIVRSDDITKDPRYGKMAPYHGMPKGHLPVRSYLAVSVISRTGSVLGGLFFGHERPGVFGPQHEQLADGVASWAAVAMDNARLFEAEMRARTEAERANRAKGDFLAVMSHELRTPLNAIIGYTDLLLLGIRQDPEDDNTKLARIGFSARHLLQLIDEILTFSRLEAGEEKVEIEPVDPAQILAEVEALMQPLALKKGIDFRCTGPEVPLQMQSDARKIRQILVNLVTNAIKFTKKGEVKLRLEQVGDDILYHVTDSGIGIAPEHQEKIFDAFWRVETSATRATDGTGLGLSVSRRLARFLGGDLTVRSELNRGSTFVLRLPAAADLIPQRSKEPAGARPMAHTA